MLVTENDDSNTDKVKDEGAVKDTEEKEKQGREDGESITTAEASDGNKDEDLSPNTEASPREAILLSIGTPLKGMFTNKEAFDHVRGVALKNTKSKWKTANKDNPKKIKTGWGKDTQIYDGEIQSTGIDDEGQRYYNCVFHLPQKDMRLDINDVNRFDFLINSERSHDDEPGEEVDTFSSEQPTEETGIERIYKVNWHQDEEDPTLFMPMCC